MDIYELDFDDIPKNYNITINQWNLLTIEQQEQYIKDKNIRIKYSTDISDCLTRGFGHLDQWGFWEYQCKQV